MAKQHLLTEDDRANLRRAAQQVEKIHADTEDILALLSEAARVGAVGSVEVARIIGQLQAIGDSYNAAARAVRFVIVYS